MKGEPRTVADLNYVDFELLLVDQVEDAVDMGLVAVRKLAVIWVVVSYKAAFGQAG